MRECELCGQRARIHCEADQASLCWGCDEKVHGANFLVAKHTRSLLCHVCHLPTPWEGSGPKLTPTVSVCEICVGSSKIKRFDDGDDRDDPDDGDGDGDGDDDDDDDEEEEEEDGDDVEAEDENQVVPWSCCSYSAAEAPPPAASCSSSEDEEAVSVSKRRKRENADVDFDGTASSSGSMRKSKRTRLSEESRLPSRRSTDGIEDGDD